MRKALSLTLAIYFCLSIFSLTANANSNQWIKLTKSSFDPNETIIVTVSSVTAQMAEALAWVGVYKAGASFSDYGDWHYVNKGTDTYTFTAPEKQGQYEFRFFREFDYNAVTLVSTLSFSVGQTAANKVINNTGNNMLSRKKVTPEDVTEDNASVTQEQAIAINMSIADNLKDKLIDYSGGNQTPAPTPTQTPSGSVDTELLGVWMFSTGYTYYYAFRDDGAFNFFQNMSGTLSSAKGRYTTSNGVIYLTELVSDIGTKLKNQELKYSLGTDAKGEYLSIPNFYFITDSHDVPDSKQLEFRRQSGG